MKRLGLIIVMALVLTIGGVYATFNYAQNDVLSATQTMDKTLAGADTETAKGTIAINTESFMLKIDDTSKSLKIGLTTQGNVKVTFTPAAGADTDVKENGVDLKLEIAFSNNTYNGTDIFKTTTAYGTGISLGKGTKNSTGAFDYTVNLGEYLAVNEIFLLTKSEYDAFSTFFTNADNAKITITVSENK